MDIERQKRIAEVKKSAFPKEVIEKAIQIYSDETKTLGEIDLLAGGLFSAELDKELEHLNIKPEVSKEEIRLAQEVTRTLENVEEQINDSEEELGKISSVLK